MYVFRFLSVIVLITFIVAATSAEDISQGSSTTPPENWYQVEVILFSHPGTTSEEEAQLVIILKAKNIGFSLNHFNNSYWFYWGIRSKL